MNDDDRLLQKRWKELDNRAQQRNSPIWTDFLDLNQQELLGQLHLPCRLEGGYPEAERRMAGFGPEEGEAPLVCLRISPKSAKFAQDLTHRDFLGSLLSLGFRRDLLGDILIKDNQAWLWCTAAIAPYIQEELTQVKHTWVEVSPAEGISWFLEPPPITGVLIASTRLDALVAAVYRLSRGDSQALISQGKVFVNSRLCQNSSLQLAPEQLVSVRGVGRFRYVGVERETRKGKLRAQVRIY